MCPKNPGPYLVVAYSLADGFVNLELSREVLAPPSSFRSKFETNIPPPKARLTPRKGLE